MPVFTEEQLRKVVLEKYELARSSLLLEKRAYESVSNRIPNYNADTMEFGAYNSDEFVVLFADMRNSTGRSESIGSRNTFLTIHAIMPALIYIVEAYGGYVIDLPGDGVMALFKENRKGIRWTSSKKDLNSEELGYEAGKDILQMVDKVVNRILKEDDIPAIEFGIGVSSGQCIVTKVGTNSTYDTKAIGSCINQASKKSDGFGEMKISSSIYNSLNKLVRNGLVDTNDGWLSYKKN